MGVVVFAGQFLVSQIGACLGSREVIFSTTHRTRRLLDRFKILLRRSTRFFTRFETFITARLTSRLFRLPRLYGRFVGVLRLRSTTHNGSTLSQ